VIYSFPWDKNTLSSLQNAVSVDASTACYHIISRLAFRRIVNGCHRSQNKAFLMISHSLAYARNVQRLLFANVMPTPSLVPDYAFVGVMKLAKIHLRGV
jgi:hypothetical protein